MYRWHAEANPQPLLPGTAACASGAHQEQTHISKPTGRRT
ncbi:Homoserine kinase [Actinoplanes sp. SE50]|nr:hypothetical protein ACPL_5874 [Actinoplanes sp. SE50/110]ATO85158.1 Homoserine kinase [Actinoplanes sp. SE50]SLM02569.1 hypothetical protein ACSP50_5819 [Actinoplanes sp. SE50/110]